MASLFSAETISTGTDEDSASLACAGYKVGLSVTADAAVTVTAQVSADDSTYFDFPLAVALNGDSDPQGYGIVVPADGSLAMTLDVSPFQYFRVNVANASGGDAVVTATAVPYFLARC